MIYATLSGSTLYHLLMYTIKINDIDHLKIDDKHTAWSNFRAIARQFEHKTADVSLFDADELIYQKPANRMLLDSADQANANDVLKAVMQQLNIDIKQLKNLVADSYLQLSNSRIDGWMKAKDDRKFAELHNDELIVLLQLMIATFQTNCKTPQNILAARQKLGWTQSQFAEKLGMKPTHLQVHRWETGQAEMPDKKWQQVQKFLADI